MRTEQLTEDLYLTQMQYRKFVALTDIANLVPPEKNVFEATQISVLSETGRLKQGVIEDPSDPNAQFGAAFQYAIGAIADTIPFDQLPPIPGRLISRLVSRGGNSAWKGFEKHIEEYPPRLASLVLLDLIRMIGEITMVETQAALRTTSMSPAANTADTTKEQALAQQAAFLRKYLWPIETVTAFTEQATPLLDTNMLAAYTEISGRSHTGEILPSLFCGFRNIFWLERKNLRRPGNLLTVRRDCLTALLEGKMEELPHIFKSERATYQSQLYPFSLGPSKRDQPVSHKMFFIKRFE
ncbi:hypothetical protein HY468_05875 [Candidatus Roizmanbacteria bacterium]|nr:hypothetical protein [Candidatus Roizmanbacteria bacterium]